MENEGLKLRVVSVDLNFSNSLYPLLTTFLTFTLPCKSATVLKSFAPLCDETTHARRR